MLGKKAANAVPYSISHLTDNHRGLTLAPTSLRAPIKAGRHAVPESPGPTQSRTQVWAGIQHMSAEGTKEWTCLTDQVIALNKQKMVISKTIKYKMKNSSVFAWPNVNSITTWYELCF